METRAAKRAKIDVSTLAPIEKLPRELLHAIVEYAMNAIPQLRLSSQMLRKTIDEIIRRSTPPIRKLTVKGGIDDDDKSQIQIFIPRKKSALFTLRLKMQNLSGKRQIKEETDCSNKEELKVYLVDLTQVASNKNWLAYIRECLGNTIEKVLLLDRMSKDDLRYISKLLENFRFPHLEIRPEIMNDDVANHLLETCRSGNVDHLTLEVGEIKMSDPVKLLLDLSSIVRSLHVIQKSLGAEHFLSRNFFFGTFDADWPAIILQMFSKKLDRLNINNHTYPAYISRPGGDLLIERIVSLGKKVWFLATCKAYATQPIVQKENNYTIRAVSTFLEVKHAEIQPIGY
ncbi:hypothetical protein PRIPAC_78074 [Pristionchus pacificus]|uniref:Uncharacterized protein n=1 Tax=Pristionchus pacificus TaxID=54126 RepID=A0A2A6BI54_PRIPA|nr:hypothetical protein PRIPAC_78074 [Pristionchus pacificus]|eukprot:PDM65590.1 hypothetical protein PRIPAC_52532 [Pristionchus pacificus]